MDIKGIKPAGVIQFFKQRNKNMIGIAFENMSGRRVKVIEGFCVAKKLFEKNSLYALGYDPVKTTQLNGIPEIKKLLLETLPA